MADVLGFFRKSMPYISAGLSLAGPPGNAAAAVLGKVFGQANPTIKSVTDALNGMTLTPELQVQLKEAELQYSQVMTQAGYQSAEELAQIDETDRASARQMQAATKSWLPGMLAGLAVCTLALCIYMVGFRKLPDEGHDAIIFLLGIVSGINKDVYSYFFGSSSGSDRKTELMAGNGH